MRLLLAEDEKSLARAIAAILKKNNYTVDVVYDGATALDYLEVTSYDGVIMDIMMPKLDGITALKKLRDKKDLTPVLLLTAKSEVDEKVLGLDTGANDYLTKPFAAKELLAQEQILKMIENLPEAQETADGLHYILYSNSRIKSPASMSAKLKRKGLPINAATAIDAVNDAVGVRVVCAFTDDVYRVISSIRKHPDYEVIKEKDYIRQPKPNGYRSFHLIVRTVNGPGSGINVELQLRTIAEDFWAALEHQMKYKHKHKIEHEKLISSELKRCADEIASVDLSMQILRDLLMGKSKLDPRSID